MTTTYPVIKGALVSSKQYTWNTADSLGRGASAIVYLGRHQKTGQVVAVKVFHKHLALSTTRQDNFRELQLLRNLKHPNIIRLLDIERDISTNQPVLVMEYCEGGSLHHMIDQPHFGYGLPEDQYLLVLHHVADGIRYLRRENIIHRDIKPGNIMRYITNFGMSVYKLTDFGAARNLEDEENFNSLYGTEEYLHPGVYEKAVLRLPTGQSFDARVDLWSLGVTFYHTATGQLPFKPFGGRSNRETMFQIISQKESGVISGIQTTEKGEIEWARDLPDTCPLSSGLRSLVIPLIAGLMEPDMSKMISYESFFRIIDRLIQKVKITFFHYAQSEELVLYVDSSANFAALQDLIASHTDISAANQILLLEGKCLEELIDPVSPINTYPLEILEGPVFLFQSDINDSFLLKPPHIPIFPDLAFAGMEQDARNANMCCIKAELIKRNTEKYVGLQKHLIKGIFCFRIYIETRLQATKPSHSLMRQLMEEFQNHFESFFKMATVVRDILLTKSSTNENILELNKTINENLIRPVYYKANERIKDIEKYRDGLVDKLEEVKNLSGRLQSVCERDKCCDRARHHLSVITGAQSRFRRDKNVKNQMTQHDEHIHHCERQKLERNCGAIKDIAYDHCFDHLTKLFKDCLHICDQLSRFLGRVTKVEVNITSVLKCQKLLSDRIVKLRDSTVERLMVVQDSGYNSTLKTANNYSPSIGELTLNQTEAPATNLTDTSLFSESVGGNDDISNGAKSLADQTRGLEGKLKELNILLERNSEVLLSLDTDDTASNPGSSDDMYQQLNDLSRYQVELGDYILPFTHPLTHPLIVRAKDES